ncbi:hypothetical protein BSIN_3316 [Burkholderia singularis]|uniref:Uncharacterized protein n=1 Tax=Burkholderia singularis TaxID=1503053 RepID=A0A238H4T3_9BURK|nr:hypothetical protein BSIN_3316 [Burkholderia singularis]
MEIRANGRADARGNRLSIRSRQNRGFALPGPDGREAGAGRTEARRRRARFVPGPAR